MLTAERRKQISKFLSLVLRHEPEKLGLTPGAQGFVPLADLLAAMRQKRSFQDVTEDDLREVVALSDKQRYEIAGNQIRARYGHSFEEPITYTAIEPPEILYHGTSPAALPAIRAAGLLPMTRQYVHLSSEIEQARQVGRRHAAQPVILPVAARAAWQSGVKFYQPEPRLYLANAVPPSFLGEEVCS